MDKEEFYSDKTVVKTEWWLEEYSFPDAVWGRLRVFSNGCADVCFDSGSTLYGFNSVEYAGLYLSDLAYICLDNLEAEDALAYGIRVADFSRQHWHDSSGQVFTYLGAY